MNKSQLLTKTLGTGEHLQVTTAFCTFFHFFGMHKM